MSENPSSKHHLTVKGLVKYFGDDRAVDDITFGIPEGKFLALLGPLRLRQDDHPDVHRRPSQARRGRD
jgi:hypothetical protein